MKIRKPDTCGQLPGLFNIRSLFPAHRLAIAGLALLLVAVSPVLRAEGSAVDLSDPATADAESGKRDTARRDILYFSFGDTELRPAASPIIESIIDAASQDETLRIRIDAHTDNRGWSLGNLELSRLRARSAALALVMGGIPVERILARAHGEAQPVAPNATARGRSLNRRVEIALIR